MTNQTCRLEINNVSFAYNSYDKIISDFSMSALPGELISLIGKNGAGKTTLFKCLLGIIKNYDGSILIDDIDIRKMRPKELAKKVAYIPQSHSPAFNFSVLDMVMMGTANQLSGLGSPGIKHELEARDALEKVGISHLTDKGYAQISGGEQQLVLMARAIVQKAEIWVLDEPLASLDYGNQIRVLKQLKQFAREGYLIIQSIHNPDQAYRYSDRIIALADGAKQADGKPEEIMDEAFIKRIYGEDIEWKKTE